jgi:hypothetical protein
MVCDQQPASDEVQSRIQVNLERRQNVFMGVQMLLHCSPYKRQGIRGGRAYNRRFNGH